MAKLMIIEDNPIVEIIGVDYRGAIGKHDIHFAFYTDNDYFLNGIKNPEEAAITKEKMCQRIKQAFSFSSTVPYTHTELVEYLKHNLPQFDRFILDGLEGKCFRVITDVPLPLEKTIVVSSSPSVIEACKAEKIPYSERARLHSILSADPQAQ